MTGSQFAAAVDHALLSVGAARVARLADGIAAGQSRTALAALVAVPEFPAVVGAVLDAQQADAVSSLEASAYLRGAAAGYARHDASLRIEPVWSGPSSHAVPVRSTARVLVELVDEARKELLLMTYSATPYPPLLTALTAAVGRGVALSIVVETLDGAGSALQGSEPAAAFASVPQARLWHWPSSARAEHGAKMHAKIAVADRHALLVSSANLTQSGIGKNIEAGLVVRGGTAPARAAEHIDALIASGTLVPR